MFTYVVAPPDANIETTADTTANGRARWQARLAWDAIKIVVAIANLEPIGSGEVTTHNSASLEGLVCSRPGHRGVVCWVGRSERRRSGRRLSHGKVLGTRWGSELVDGPVVFREGGVDVGVKLLNGTSEVVLGDDVGVLKLPDHGCESVRDVLALEVSSNKGTIGRNLDLAKHVLVRHP